MNSINTTIDTALNLLNYDLRTCAETTSVSLTDELRLASVVR